MRDVGGAEGAVVTPLALGPTGSGALDGWVMAVKDAYAVAGIVRQGGLPELFSADLGVEGFDGRPQVRTAAVVAGVLAAGARVVATTQMDPLSWGVTTPGTRNPVAPDRIVGGSSGGAAALVAAGTVHAALGSDSGGSVRIPASACGIAGFKPTFGRLPAGGLLPVSPSCDTPGVLAASSVRCAAVLRALDPGVAAVTTQAVRRVGIPGEVTGFPLDDDIRECWEQAQDRLRAAGVRVLPVAIPELRGAAAAHGRLFVAEALAVHAEAFAAAPDRYPSWVAPLMAARAAGEAKVAKALAHGARLRAALRRTFAEVDVLLLPTMPVVTPPAGATTAAVGGEQQLLTVALTHLTAPFNLAGVPAGSVPAGSDATGAPVGVQLVGPARADGLVLAAMQRVEELLAA